MNELRESTKIESIRIENLGNITSEVLLPGTVNIRKGKNRSGKTCGLDAIRAAFQGGDNQDLIRRDSEEGTVCLNLTNGLEIAKTFRRGAKPKFSLALNNMRLHAPQTVIDELRDSFSIDPLGWVTAKASERETVLLQAIPMEVTTKQLQDLLFPLGLKHIPPVENRHAFAVLADVERYIYDERTGVNRLAKQYRENARALKSTLPEDPPEQDREDWDGVCSSLEMKIEDLRSQKHNQVVDLHRKLRDEDQDFYQQVRDACSKQLARFYDAIRDLGVGGECEIDVRGVEHIGFGVSRPDDAQSRLDSSRRLQEQTINEKFDESIELLSTQLGEARKSSQAHRDAQSTRQRIEENEDRAQKEEARSKDLTAALKDVDNMRRDFLRETPIEGLEFVENRVGLNGLPLDSLNTEQQIILGFQVALLKMKGLRVCFMDNLEALDEQHRAILYREAERNDVQLFGAMVSEGEMVTEVDAALAATA